MKYLPWLSLALAIWKGPEIIRALKEPRPNRMTSHTTGTDGFQVVTTTEYIRAEVKKRLAEINAQRELELSPETLHKAQKAARRQFLGAALLERAERSSTPDGDTATQSA